MAGTSATQGIELSDDDDPPSKRSLRGRADSSSDRSQTMSEMARRIAEGDHPGAARGPESDRLCGPQFPQLA